MPPPNIEIKLEHVCMSIQYEDLIKKAYTAFNSRDIDKVFSTFHPDVQWPNGWEGGYLYGHDQVKNYWIRQWKELNPTVEPRNFKETIDNRLEVEVYQLVKDVQGKILFDGSVTHIYSFQDGLIKSMEIVK